MTRGSTHQQSARGPADEARRLVLTESERLTLLFTKVHGLPRTGIDWLVVPTASPLALCDKWRAPTPSRSWTIRFASNLCTCRTYAPHAGVGMAGSRAD